MNKTWIAISVISTAVSALLTGCADNYPKPQINPAPKYFMTVQGYIDPALQKDLNLIWIGDFYTTNEQCYYYPDIHSHFESGPIQRDVTISFSIMPNKKGFYKQKLPINYYLPGYCGWKIIGMSYQFTYKNKKLGNNSDTGLNISHVGKHVSIPLNQRWLCDSTTCELYEKNTNYQGIVSSHYNSTSIVNFKKINQSRGEL